MQQAEIKFEREDLEGLVAVGTYLAEAARRMGVDLPGEEFGEARLVQVMERYHRGRADVVLEQVINAVKEFAHGAEQYDDVTALVVKYTGPK